MSHPATVLVVDDDEDYVDSMRDILRAEGHEVEVARNGREALDRAARKPPNLVLLDLNMPEMDGRRFLAELRKDPRFSRVVVVVLSGAADAHALETAMHVETVTKPLRLDTLLGLIDRIAQAAPT